MQQCTWGCCLQFMLRSLIPYKRSPHNWIAGNFKMDSAPDSTSPVVVHFDSIAGREQASREVIARGLRRFLQVVVASGPASPTAEKAKQVQQRVSLRQAAKSSSGNTGNLTILAVRMRNSLCYSVLPKTGLHLPDHSTIPRMPQVCMTSTRGIAPNFVFALISPLND